MLTYADSSAILAWLLNQPGGPEARRLFRGSERVSCSVLTLFECDRTLHRCVATGALSPAVAERARAAIAAAARSWSVTPLGEEVLAAARRRFPREPIRSLDALHLGTALLLQTTSPDLVLVTLDRRLAENARLLGFAVLPEIPEGTAP